MEVNFQAPQFKQKGPASGPNLWSRGGRELEDCQDIIYQSKMYTWNYCLDLHIKRCSWVSSMGSLDELDSQDYSYSLPNQRVLGFFQDPYISDCTSDLPDIVVDGVLQGFYPRDVRVSFTAPTFTEPNPTTSIEA
ncbi:sorting nexin-24-like protein [Lates japonicus]|uniref:Sorting nexin-24-like protein n=1 Tax=Lates japonicus TaxID=270547 RepID=A0AAD3N8F8_LATJO|nr:sorting nexin-24-like protein [Lates japonicus]